ncbi:argininosuccinate lyase [Sulfobacillus sp. DSM 109850]|uniref:Argininosuccinate lyase n=2 Tax=Sulfobacillus harzensis TaxID=2729629 RepID=A0A7Y0L4I1_9FIRM|nr:argininosuccinate lyase [Sulfobacillus harzensis]
MARSGRFKGGLAPEAATFCASIGFDWRLVGEDLDGSLAHLAMLEATGILASEKAAIIRRGLEQIRQEWQRGELTPRAEWEDVHMNIEGRLHEIIGPDAGYLHMARSRNDQVATDMHLYMMRVAGRFRSGLSEVLASLIELAEETASVIMPGTTHFQPAQPIRMAHHWLAYGWMFHRDLERLRDWEKRGSLSPLGAGALAGTPYPTDPVLAQHQLGFDALYQNSLDAVSDRDYLLEFLAWASIFGTHVSRMAEELVLWSHPRLGYVSLGDGYSTGSSIMPQKRNPDVAELLRGKSGRLFGRLMGLLTVMKGLPLAYNSDMQEDKEAVFDVVDTVDSILALLPGLLGSLEIYPERMRQAVEEGFVNATDLADRLAQGGMPFRQAHHRVGELVRAVIEAGYDRFEDVPQDTWETLAPDIPHTWLEHLTPEALVESRKQSFSPASASIEGQIAALKQSLRGGLGD